MPEPAEKPPLYSTLMTLATTHSLGGCPAQSCCTIPSWWPRSPGSRGGSCLGPSSAHRARATWGSTRGQSGRLRRRAAAHGCGTSERTQCQIKQVIHKMQQPSPAETFHSITKLQYNTVQHTVVYVHIKYIIYNIYYIIYIMDILMYSHCREA